MIEPVKIVHVGTFDKNKLIILSDQLDLESGRTISYVAYALEDLGADSEYVKSIDFKFPLKYLHAPSFGRPFSEGPASEGDWLAPVRKNTSTLIDLNFPLLEEISLSANIENIFVYYADRFLTADKAVLAKAAESELLYETNILQRLWFYSGFLLYVNRQCRSVRDYEYIKLKVEEHVLERGDEYQKLIDKISRLRRISQNRQQIARKQISDDILAFVLLRDLNKCVLCGDDRNLQFDHILPVSRGGNNEPENLRILCRQCNLSRGNLRNV